MTQRGEEKRKTDLQMGNIDAGQMAQWEQDMVRAWDWGLIDLGVQGMGVEEWTNGQYFNR